MNAVVASIRDPYAEAAYERIMRLKRLRADPSMLAALRAYYRDHIMQFIEDWGITIDPRNVDPRSGKRSHGRPVVMPFLLDPKQREWLAFTEANWLEEEYGGTVKSRDVGLSWLIVGFSISVCELFENVTIGWGSFKQEKVDRKGDLGSLFEKGRQYLEAQPLEFRAGHDPISHSFERRLLFPETGSSIIGEIGDNIGRGGRTTLYFVDETAYLEHDQVVDGALSKNTTCRQDVSSVRGMNNTFAQRMHQEGVRRFNFHWRENPRFTQEMYDKFLELWGPVITAQELDMNFQASVEGLLIQPAWVNAAIDAHVKLKLKVTGELLGALDIADLGIDKNAFAVRHGILLEHIEEWSGKGSDPFATTERAFLACDRHRVRTLVYDAVGVGSAVRGDARKLNEKRTAAARVVLRPFVGGAKVIDPLREMVEGRKNEDMFLNLKAQCYWYLAMLFQHTYRAVTEPAFEYREDMLISISSAIPLLTKLAIELSQPTHSQNAVGKVLVDKQPEGTPSPNLADAVMMAFAPLRRGLKISDSVFEDGEE